MNRLTIHRKITLFLAFFLALVYLAPAFAAPGDIGFSISCPNATLAVGDLLGVDIRLDTDIASFGGVLLSVRYDSDKLEYVSGAALIGTEVSSEDEAEEANGEGVMVFLNNLPDNTVPANSTVKVLALNSGGAMGGGESESLAACTLANLVFKVKAGAEALAVSIGVEQLYACDEDTTNLIGDLSTDYAAHPNSVSITVSPFPNYPADTGTSIYIVKTVALDGVVTVKLKAAGAARVQRARIHISYPGYHFGEVGTPGIEPGSHYYFNDSTRVFSIDYASDAGFDVSETNGVFATFTLIPQAAEGPDPDNIVIAGSPTPAFAFYSSNGSFSGLMQPGISADPYGGYALGDVNGDNSIDARDAVLILKSVVGSETLDDVQRQRANTLADGSIDARDAVLILKYVVGLITSF